MMEGLIYNISCSKTKAPLDGSQSDSSKHNIKGYYENTREIKLATHMVRTGTTEENLYYISRYF